MNLRKQHPLEAILEPLILRSLPNGLVHIPHLVDTHTQSPDIVETSTNLEKICTAVIISDVERKA